MIGTFLVLSHFLLRRLGIAPQIAQSTGCESICISHEGGARPPARSVRQPGGTDDATSSLTSGRTTVDASCGGNEHNSNLASTTPVTQVHDANVATSYDFRPLADSSEVIPLIGFDFESIVNTKPTNLAELGSAQCDYIIDDSTDGQELCPITLLSVGDGGGVFPGLTEIHDLSQEDLPETPPIIIISESSEASEDLPASGDTGRKTPVDLLMCQDQTKELATNGLDEVIAAILGLDDVGDTERYQTKPDCLCVDEEKRKEQETPKSSGEGAVPLTAVDETTLRSEQDAFYLDNTSLKN